jgi:prolyl-tRNA editing enzyme YbaK/EbsC (Cys-tRNA(Pro) deacylase)
MSSASAVLTSPSVQRVRQALERAGLDTDIVELPGAARTARAAAEYLGCAVAQIANSLVFRGETSGTAMLVMSSGARKVDTGALEKLVGEPVRPMRTSCGCIPASPSAAWRRPGTA